MTSVRLHKGVTGKTGAGRPPLSAVSPLLFWLGAASVLAALVLGSLRGPGALDDSDPAQQRSGLLFEADEAHSVPGLALPGDPIGRRPVVVIFDRRVPPARRLDRFVGEIPERFAVVVTVPHPVAAQNQLPRGVRSLGDSPGRVAEAVGVRPPRDGGAPVGYAVIDEQARVRYATLDPAYSEHGFEVAIVAGALG